MMRIRAVSGGYLRRTIGFVPQIVEDREDHDTFAVTGGIFIAPARVPVYDWEDATCRTNRKRSAASSTP